MGGLCSTPFTNLDIQYTERVAQVRSGTFFKAIRKAQEELPSPCEHPFEPMRRYAALARTLREPRGSKSAEHLAHLRRSDPLTRLSAWHDWAALRAEVQHSWPARIHQQRLIDRGLRAHAQLTLAEANAREAKGRSLKRDLHLGRLRTVDGVKREERTSSDSVIAFLDHPAESGATADTSSSDGEPSPSCVIPDKDYGKGFRGKGKQHIMLPPMNLEHALPPLE